MARPRENSGPDEIADHAGFAQRLARKLAHCAHVGDDVAQDALLAYVEQRPSRRSLRGWFATVVRRLSTRTRIAADRRRHRELAAARSGEGIDPATQLERAEVVERLLTHVLELDEPHRQVVLMRYYQDLPPREIAAALGVSTPAVKKRLERATARLRARMLGGQDKRTGATLVSLAALAASQPVRAATSTGILYGAMIMKTKVAVGVVVLVATIVVAWQMNGEPGPQGEHVANRLDAAATEGTSDPGSDEGTAGSIQPGVETERFRPDESGEVKSWIVRGVIDRHSLSRNTVPVPRATVEAVLYAGYDASSDPVAQATLTADEQGHFEWPLHPPTGMVTLSFRATKEGFSSSDETILADGELKPPTDVNLSIYPLSVTVTGTVRDGQGQPLSGARVARHKREVVADSQGRYEIDAYGDYPRVDLRAWADGFAEKKIEINLDPETRSVEHDIVLEHSCRVEGVISDQEGLPIAGATVRNISHRTRTVTGTDGRFVLDHLPRDRSFGIEAMKAGYVRERATVETRDDVFVRDFVLNRGVAVHGFVLDPSGKPVRGARLWIGFSRFAYNRLDAVSRDDGRFLFSSVPPGNQTLVADKPGFAVVTTKILTPDQGQTMAPLTIQMTRGNSIAGRVVDEKGHALAEVTVSAQLPEQQLDARVQTDASGGFRLECLPSGPMELLFSREDLTYHQVKITPDNRDDHVFELQHALRITGRVVDDVTGEPVTAFRIRIFETNHPRFRRSRYRSGPWGGSGALFEGAEGRWSTLKLRLRPGAELFIEARADGYAPASREDVTADSEDEIVLRMRKSCEIRGLVVRARTGLPMEGVTVTADSDSDRRDDGGWEGEDVRPRARTDSGGRFSLTGMGPGEFRLLVEAPERPVAIDGPFAVVTSKPTHRVIELAELGRLEGILQHGDGDPTAGARVTLQRLGLPRSWEQQHRHATTTDAQGRFAFPNLAPGPYSLGLEERNGDRRLVVLSRKIQVAPAEPTKVRFGFPGSSTLTGEVVSDVKLPANLVASLSGPSGKAGAIRNAFVIQGRFTFPGLVNGTYDLSVDAYVSGAWIKGSARVDVAAGGTTVTVRMK